MRFVLRSVSALDSHPFLWGRLLEVHDDVPIVARPARGLVTNAEAQWYGEHAMGRGVLSNRLQRWSLEAGLIIDHRHSHVFNCSLGGGYE